MTVKTYKRWVSGLDHCQERNRYSLCVSDLCDVGLLWPWSSCTIVREGPRGRKRRTNALLSRNIMEANAQIEKGLFLVAWELQGDDPTWRLAAGRLPAPPTVVNRWNMTIWASTAHLVCQVTHAYRAHWMHNIHTVKQSKEQTQPNIKYIQIFWPVSVLVSIMMQPSLNIDVLPFDLLSSWSRSASLWLWWTKYSCLCPPHFAL